MNNLSDEQLMGRFCDGEVAAFQLLFEKYRDRLFRFVHRVYLRDRQQAEDCVQEAFLKVIRHREQFDRALHFSTWLYAIARNHCLNQLRGGQPEPAPLDEVPEPSGPVSAREVLQQRELHDLIREAVAGLPEALRAVFVMHEVDGFTHAEIGAVLGLAEGNVRIHLHRARQALQQQLAGYLEGTDNERG